MRSTVRKDAGKGSALFRDAVARSGGSTLDFYEGEVDIDRSSNGRLQGKPPRPKINDGVLDHSAHARLENTGTWLSQLMDCHFSHINVVSIPIQ